LSKLFDRLKNAARLRARAGADHSLLAQALQRAAQERAQSRAAGDPPATGSANAMASQFDDTDWAKLLAANDGVDSRAADAISRPGAEEGLHDPERAERDERDPPARASRRRVARGIALALVALVTLVVISFYLAQSPPEPVPVFQLDKTLR
jgi:hypothetical protein